VKAREIGSRKTDEQKIRQRKRKDPAPKPDPPYENQTAKKGNQRPLIDPNGVPFSLKRSVDKDQDDQESA
jgi:hypothetical protein